MHCTKKNQSLVLKILAGREKEQDWMKKTKQARSTPPNIQEITSHEIKGKNLNKQYTKRKET